MLRKTLTIALAVLLGGCAHYEVSNNVPLSLGGRIANSLDKTGKMKVDFFNYMPPEYYEGKGKLYVLTFADGMQYKNLAEYELRGVDFNFEMKEYLERCGGMDACRKQLVAKNGLSRIAMKRNAAGVDVGHSARRDIYLMARAEPLSGREIISSLVIEYNDYSASSDRDFKNAQSAKTVAAFSGFLKKYPQSTLIPGATRNLLDLLAQRNSAQEYLDVIKEIPRSLTGHKELTDKFFENNFSVKIVTKNSKQRPITEKSLLTSMAGSCIDIKKSVTISPRRKLDFANDVSLDLTFTLLRTYAPYQLAEDGDPLLVKKVYLLRKSSGFVQSEEIAYPCVLSAGRFHAAGLSLLGKLMGKSREETGINTTLTKMDFDLKVEGAR